MRRLPNGYHERAMTGSHDSAGPTDMAPLLEQVGAYVDARLPRWHTPAASPTRCST